MAENELIIQIFLEQNPKKWMTDRKSTYWFGLSATAVKCFQKVFVNPITIAKILSVFKFQVVEIVNYQNGSKNALTQTLM